MPKVWVETLPGSVSARAESSGYERTVTLPRTSVRTSCVTRRRSWCYSN